MATIAFDKSDAQSNSPSITLHPAFPAIVALWFAALFGLGFLILPGVLLDRLVETTGLAAVLPAAAPPLGFTARAILSLAAGLGGAALGLALARRVGAQGETGPGHASRAGSRRPLNVHEELGDDAPIAPGAIPPLRRRAPLMTGDPAFLPTPPALEAAPLPGADEPTAGGMAADSWSADDGMVDDATPHEIFASDQAADDPLELSDLAEEEPGGPLWTAAAEESPRLDLNQEPGDVDLPELSIDPSPQLRPVADAPDTAAPVPGWVEAPLEDLGLVQLVQRLGSALEQRRAALACPSGPELIPPAAIGGLASPVIVPTGVEAARPDEAAQAIADYFGTAAAANVEVEIEVDQALASSDAPEASSTHEPQPGAREADDTIDEEFSSLLALRPAAPAKKFVDLGEWVMPGDDDGFGPPAAHRTFDPPAETPTPAKSAPTAEAALDAPTADETDALPVEAVEVAAPAAADADAALRAALATLQRMSGAA